MNDLISRKVLLTKFEKMKSGAKSLFETMFFDAVMAMVDNQPTAYDIDKVVEQLYENGCVAGSKNGFVLLSKAIPIVKGAVKDE